jgi:hypothetical protein
MKIDNTIKQSKHKNNSDAKQKWVSFTFSGNYVRTITKLFKNTNIKIAFKTNNTIGNILKERTTTNKYEQTGIYKLTCTECNKAYIGQTGRTLEIRYKEHIRSIMYNRDDSRFATHILNNAHCYGKMEDIMEKIDHAKKGRLMNIKDNFHIHMYKQRNKLIDEQRAHEDNHANILYDIASTFLDTPTQPHYSINTATRPPN